HKLHAAKARVDEALANIIRQGRERQRRDANSGTDLLSMLFSAVDADGASMTDQEIRDELMVLFLAGQETTALALTWSWILVSQDRRVEAKLHQVVDDVLGGRAATLADLPRLKYVDAILNESMRLYPPTWAVGREAIEDTTLGGFHVPKGTQLWLSPW